MPAPENRPDEARRKDDELVEPLFAGLEDADRASSSAAADADAGEAVWRRSRRPRGGAQSKSPTSGTNDPDLEADDPGPSTARLLLVALLLTVVLVGLGAFVYFAFGV